ncbi:hypothetical protein GCM10010343_11980 [Streptomyces avidinii]|nr:hypothetical protein GCM10010343_11980 [Streptomyces avidinii]
MFNHRDSASHGQQAMGPPPRYGPAPAGLASPVTPAEQGCSSSHGAVRHCQGPVGRSRIGKPGQARKRHPPATYLRPLRREAPDTALFSFDFKLKPRLKNIGSAKLYRPAAGQDDNWPNLGPGCSPPRRSTGT